MGCRYVYVISKGAAQMKSTVTAVAVCLSLSTFAYGQSRNSSERCRSEAESGLKRFVTAIQPESLADFGLSQAEIGKIRLDEPYPLYRIPVSVVTEFAGSEATVSSVVTSTGRLLYPATVGGKIRSFLVVVDSGIACRAVAFGYGVLAASMSAWVGNAKWQGRQPLLIHVPQAGEYFLAEDSGWSSEIVALGSTPEQPRSERVVDALHRLRPSVLANLNAWRRQ
jgi:hypothetical protein